MTEHGLVYANTYESLAEANPQTLDDVGAYVLKMLESIRRCKYLDEIVVNVSQIFGRLATSPGLHSFLELYPVFLKIS